MTPHPCVGMTKLQRNWFERIAINDPGSAAHPKTIAALIARGLIERGQDRVFGSGWSAVRVRTYFVPLRFHIQWCQWASEQPGEADDA